MTCKYAHPVLHRYCNKFISADVWSNDTEKKELHCGNSFLLLIHILPYFTFMPTIKLDLYNLFIEQSKKEKRSLLQAVKLLTICPRFCS